MLLALIVGACVGPILANPTLAPVVIPTASPAPSRLADPQPVVFPRDDGPHDRLTEWWYYTGHLLAEDGRRFGFEFVVFRAERGSASVTWASHLALTDEAGDRFLYAQRAEVGAQVDASPRDASGSPTGFALAIAGIDPSEPGLDQQPPWSMLGSGGRDHINAGTSHGETRGAVFGLALDLVAGKAPALHGGAGWIDFGGTGSSYYYSRTRMTVSGEIALDSTEMKVTGEAWFDHQWGDFIAVGGGWDWFAVNLADGTDLTISVVRAVDGSTALTYGTLVEPDGTALHLEPDTFQVVPVAGLSWTSPATGATYPAGWSISVGRGLAIDLLPTVADQELDTRATTGVAYWEGSQTVTAFQGRRIPLAGQAYVELTGYAPAAP